MAAVEDDESWLYGNKSEEITTDTKKADEEEKNREEDKDTDKNEAGDGGTDNNKAAENEVENGVNASANQDADTETEIDSSFIEVDRIDTNKTLDDREAGELSGEEFGGRAGREDEDSDSDDDDVQVTIGDIKSAPSYGYGGAPVNLNIKRGSGYASGLPGVASSAKTKGIDLDVVGSINGVPTYEFNLDSLEDKPWRKPGADITDYFNYGFNEDTWKAYCEKQRKLRIDTTAGAVKTHGHGHPVKDQQIPVATVNENSKYAGRGLASAGPPPGRKASGCIDVIGGSTTTSRRPLNLSPKENVIQVQVMTADKRDYGRKPFIEGMPPPPPGLQPPHLGPPPGFIPPDLSIPPPGLPPSGMMPPGLPPPGLPPPPPHPDSISGFPDHFGGFGPPRGGYLPPIPPGPNSDRGFDGHGFPYSGGQTPYNPFEPTGEPPWEPLDRTGGQQYNPNWDFPVSERSMDKSPQHSPGHDDDPERRQSSRDRRERDRFRERDRDRERERTVDRERDRDRDRHSERDRDRDYEYDERRERDRDRRHREHRDRDKEHRSSRRKHRDDGEESEHSRSRHKRKRIKIKQEKEDDVGEGSGTQDTAPEAPPPEQEEAAE